MKLFKNKLNLMSNMIPSKVNIGVQLPHKKDLSTFFLTCNSYVNNKLSNIMFNKKNTNMYKIKYNTIKGNTRYAIINKHYYSTRNNNKISVICNDGNEQASTNADTNSMECCGNELVSEKRLFARTFIRGCNLLYDAVIIGKIRLIKYNVNGETRYEVNNSYPLTGGEMYKFGVTLVGIAFAIGTIVFCISQASRFPDDACKMLLFIPFAVPCLFLVGLVVGLVWPVSVPIMVMNLYIEHKCEKKIAEEYD